MRFLAFSSYNRRKGGFLNAPPKKRLCSAAVIVILYIGQGWVKIGSKEMIHYVKEAAQKAPETVERHASQKIDRITPEPFKLAKGSFFKVNCIKVT
ncbi:hypothetical protein ABXS71_07015 [Bacillus infantis]